MPVVEDYGVSASNKFAGKIGKVTVGLKDMKAADRAAAEKTSAEPAHRKAVAN